MEQLHINGWTLEFDRAATANAYALARPVGPEACSCSYCRNFVAARDVAYPKALRDFAHAVGIQPLTETEIWDNGPFDKDPSVRHYAGFFHFVGRIVAEARTPVQDFYFLERRSLLPSAFGSLPVVEVEFSFPVPWLLAEPPEPVTVG